MTQQVTIRDVLTKALTLVENPATFTTNSLARDADGMSVYALDERAVCWCSLGAVIKAGGELGHDTDLVTGAALSLLHDKVRKLGIVNGFVPMNNMADFNDTASHDRVVKFWKDLLNTDLD